MATSRRTSADLDLEPRPIGVSRETLLAALRGYFTHRGFDANWDAIKRLPDDMLVVTLAMVCPFEPAEKQALLEAPDRCGAGRGTADAAADGRAGAGHAGWAQRQLNGDRAMDEPAETRRQAPIDPRLLEILVCPLTKGPLEYDREASELISRKAGLAYPVRDGIPIMLPEEARKLEE